MVHVGPGPRTRGTEPVTPTASSPEASLSASRHGAHSQAPVQGRVAIAQRSDHDAESTSTRLRYLDGPTYEVSLRGAAATPRDASERRLPHT
jgi:hypothetical protein